MSVRLHLQATVYGTGPYHPAFYDVVSTEVKLRYWPNITFLTKEEAMDYAIDALSDVSEAINSITDTWNVTKS